MSDLTSRLRALARFEHSDYSIGDEAADALEARAWQPIKTAPKDQLIIVTGYDYGKPDSDRHYAFAIRSGDTFIERPARPVMGGGGKLGYLTHWCPVPTPPESEQ